MDRQWMWAGVLGLAMGAVTIGADEPKEKPAAPAPKAAEKPADKTAEKAAPAESGPFATQKAKISYGIGINIGHTLTQQGITDPDWDVDLNLLLEGIKDAVTKAKPRVPEEQLQAALQEFSKTMEGKMAAKAADAQAKHKEAADKAKKDGEVFLASNGKKEGVKSTASGLQYQVIKQGEGPKPKASDTVTVHYKGTLVNGEEFDSSYKRNSPATFPLDQVIPGWTEGLQLMTVGSKYKLVIPYELGYGPQGKPPTIPGYSVLVFEVELLKIEKQGG